MNTQLELFEVSRTPPLVRNRMAGMGNVQLRSDHAVLCGMVALIGVAVVFGMGVERGKLLARSERMLIGYAAGATLNVPAASSAPAPTTQKIPATAPEVPKPAGIRPTPAQHATPKTPTPTNTVAAKSTYAIQVVTYSKSTLARQELTHLQRRGEQAFLIERTDGRMVLCVGPFPTRQHASVKLSNLKQRYQDCFIRSL